MGDFAQTNIDAGKAGTFARGDEVKGLDDKELQKLRESNAIGDKPPEPEPEPTPGQPGKPTPEPAGLPKPGDQPAQQPGQQPAPRPGHEPPVDKRGGR